MFCSNCGSNIPDGSAHCSQCGAPTGAAQKPVIGNEPIGNTFSNVYQAMTNPDQPMVPVQGGGTAALVDTMRAVPARLIAKIAFLVALVCFAFPFMSVSCDASAIGSLANQEAGGDYSFEIVYKGYNLIFPSTISEKNVKTGSGFNQKKTTSTTNTKSGDDYGSDEKSNPWLIITVICCAAGAVVLFIRKDKLFSAIASCLGLIAFICLLVFKGTFVSRYFTSDNVNMQGAANYLQVNTKFGFVLCLISIILALIASVISWITDSPSCHQRF